MSSPPIGPGARVTLKFSLSMATGELIDETGEKAATFSVGDGSLLPGFEAAMFGMRAGESGSLVIPAKHAFGEPNDENVHMMKRRDFSQDLDMVEGLVVSFADSEGSELPGVVSRVLGDMVEIDFNHPLAGRELLFAVEILDVEQVSEEIFRG